ncbi:hypothetical protein ACQKMI_12360 [Lysinibacillus sp. NPDC097214]|uniref:hypothetical protein n=1 Tax=Lysinibacillus sp. NPDC097214 TaxID=3390584 RepID=UPI003D03C4F2
MVLHVGLYKKYQYNKNVMGFYQNLEDLRKLKEFDTQDEALDYAIEKLEGAKVA